MPNPETSGSGGVPPPKQNLSRPTKPTKNGKAAAPVAIPPALLGELRALAGAALVAGKLGSGKSRVLKQIDALVAAKLAAVTGGATGEVPEDRLMLAGELGLQADAVKNAASRAVLLKAAKSLLGG